MGLAAVLLAAPSADAPEDASDAAVAGLWGVWTHPLRQLQLLYSLLVLGEDTFTFTAVHTRRVLTLDALAQAPAVVQSQAQHAVDSTWNSLDLIETLMELAGSASGAEDGAEVGKAVTAILERAIKTHAELVLLGLVQLPQSTNAVHPELVSKLLVMFLAGHAQQQLVFWQLWHTSPTLLLDLLLRVYRESPLHLARIVEVAHELQFVDRLLELRPLAFALDVAAYAARRAVGIIWPPPRWMGSAAMSAWTRRNLTLRIGSSHSGPSRVAHWKPCLMCSRTSARRFLSTSSGSVSSTSTLGPSSAGPNAQMLRAASASQP